MFKIFKISFLEKLQKMKGLIYVWLGKNIVLDNRLFKNRGSYFMIVSQNNNISWKK
jgi:hypothetical protein